MSKRRYNFVSPYASQKTGCGGKSRVATKHITYLTQDLSNDLCQTQSTGISVSNLVGTTQKPEKASLKRKLLKTGWQ